MNYGQALQGAALQFVLKRLGHEPELIRYAFNNKPSTRLKDFLTNPKNWLVVFLRRCRYRKETSEFTVMPDWRSRRFRDFRAKYMIQGAQEFKNYEELTQNTLNYEAYLVGSDQVWALPFFDECTRAWFLDFGSQKAKRIAYAASFGTGEVSAKQLVFMRPRLKAFNGVGVREASGVEICAKAGYANAVHVLDPTLLLEKNDYMEWVQVEGNILKKNSKKYAFMYFLRTSGNMPWREMQKLCDNLRLQAKFTSVGPARDLSFVSMENPTPTEWIQLIAEASIVFTNSFHGTCFAILMHRPFVVFLRDGVSERANERVFSLLKILGLEGQIYSNDPAKLLSQVSTTINWPDVDGKLANLRKDSLRFLEKALA